MSFSGAPGGSGPGPSGIGGGIFRSIALGRPHSPSYNEIVPHLYLGDINTATNKDELTRLGITDMITIETKPVQVQDLAACVKRYLFINIIDHSKQDILSHLDTSYEFIDSALKVPTNKVYVHCVAGISRSASLVIAYVMKSRSLTYNEAYDLVSRRRRVVDPNEGFVRQLVLYHKMRYTIDIANMDYRRLVLDALAFEFRFLALSLYQMHTSKISGTGLSAVSTSTSSNLYILTKDHKDIAAQTINACIIFDQYYSKLHLQEVNKFPQVYDQSTAFKCTKCRAIVFYAISVIENKLEATKTPTGSETLSNLTSCSGSGGGLRSLSTKIQWSSKECPFVFIEPQPWMGKSILEKNGNLECYKCKRKLGKFDWTSAENCSCEAHNSHININLFKIMRKKVEAGNSHSSREA